MHLVHDGWEARDVAAREGYDGGWDGVLARFVAQTEDLR